MSGLRTFTRFYAALLLWLPVFYCAAEDEAAPPSPLPAAIGQTPGPDEENQPAEVEGTVTFVGDNGRETYLEISSENSSMPVTMAQGAGILNDLLLKCRVRVRGTREAIHGNMDGKSVANLLVAGVDDLTILQVPEETWQSYPLTAIGALLQTNFPASYVHLHGKIESVQPGISFLLADETGETTIAWKPVTADLSGTKIEALCAWGQEGLSKVLRAGMVRPLAQATNNTSLPTLTTTEQVRWLKPEEAARGYPVKVRAVVTYLPETRRRDGNIQDGTGGVFAWHLVPADGGTAVRPGDFCEIEGSTAPGQFAPGIYCENLKILGRGEFPEPMRPKWGDLASGNLDQQWVEIEGVVLSATSHRLQVGTQGGQITCYVVGGTNLERFSNSIVLVRGIVAASWDESRHIQGVHLNLPSREFISLETSPLSNPFSLPVKQIKDLLFYDPGKPAFRRQKVEGEIIGARNGVYYLTDGTNGLRLNIDGEARLVAGDMVEAVGFPETDYSTKPPLIALHDVVVRVTGRKPLPAAAQIAPGVVLTSGYDSTLVRVEAKLVHLGVYGSGQVLELQADARTFFARLNTSAGMIPEWPAGSRVELTGVYVFNNGKDSGPADAGPFELLLNSPADVAVLELPSWWTAQHALIVICTMALAILLAVVWIGLLRQQVGKRTAELSAANQSLTGEIVERRRAENELVQTRLQHLVEKERTRIARDLHDDLGSRVTRIVLLNELALQSRVPPESSVEHAREISSAARQVIQSLDETVWAVNPRNDTLPHLLNYFSQFTVEFLKAANVRCRLDFPDLPPPRAISAEARHNLFLAVKEALNNAIRHAQATEVWLRAVVSDESLVLTVEDNGHGFERTPGHPSEDGLRNMRQRMEEMGGQFNLESAPKAGTKVTLTYCWSPPG